MLRMPQRRRRQGRAIALRSLCVAAVALAALVLSATPASAHTDLESATPPAEASVAELTRIDLRFSEGIELAASGVWVQDAAGYLALGPATHLDGDGATMSVPVPPLGDGTYEVTWHVVTADGTPAHGTYPLTIATASGEPGPVPPTVGPAAPPDGTAAEVPAATPRRLEVLPELAGDGHSTGGLTNAVARGVLDASLATLVGGLAFVVAVWPQGARLVRTRQVLWIAAVLATFASFELAAFQHAAASGLTTAEALSPWHQWDALQFRFGRIAAARMVLLGVSAVLTARLTRGSRTTGSVGWRAATAVVALGLVQTVALLGHSSDPGALAASARLLHVLAVSVWIGGLVMLLCVVVPRRRVEELVAVLPRFSNLATGAVAILTVGGVLLSVDLVGTAGALPSTGYGRVLLAKVLVVALLLVAASLTRRHVRTRLAAPGRLAADSVVRPLAVWVGTEVGLVAVVLGMSAALVSRVPPA
jgi:putative copper export protein/methionine-rich copper-binding protein CopC